MEDKLCLDVTEQDQTVKAQTLAEVVGLAPNPLHTHPGRRGRNKEI